MRGITHPVADYLRMGIVTSQCRGQSLDGWEWRGSPGEHSPYPRDLVPYPGDELLYCYLDIITKYKIMRNTMNLGPSVVTTNVDEYLEELNQATDAGFILHHFTKVPGIKSTIEVQNWAESHPYQAILSRPAHRPQTEKWRLKVEKRILSTRLLATAEYEEKKDLINTIHENASKGERLMCAETIGYVRSDATSNNQYVVMGVDMFFGQPLHPNPIHYVYHTVRVPVRYMVVPDSTQTVQQIHCDADWIGQLKLFLDKGWKLVDICIDTTALADAFGMKNSSKLVDTMWIFEKPYAKLNDPEPMYEGVILEYFHKTKRLIGIERPAKDWRPVIAGMGVSGWELATIIQTPYLSQSTFTTYILKLLMVFQRPIDRDHQRLTRDIITQQSRQAFDMKKSQSLSGSASFGLLRSFYKKESKHPVKPATGGGLSNGQPAGTSANNLLLHPSSALTGGDRGKKLPPLYTHTRRPSDGAYVRREEEHPSFHNVHSHNRLGNNLQVEDLT